MLYSQPLFSHSQIDGQLGEHCIHNAGQERMKTFLSCVSKVLVYNVVYFIFKLEEFRHDREVTPKSFPMKTLTSSLKDYV